MAFNSATESFEGRTEFNQQLTTALSAEALFTQGGNDLYKKAVNASMKFSSTGDLPSCDDLLKQLNDAKSQPLYDKTEKGAKPAADETPTLKSWAEATKVREAHKTGVIHTKSWAEIIKSANEAQHKIAEHARKEPDVVSVTESKKNGEKIEMVTVEKKNGSKIVYKPTGETKHYPARPLPGNAALEDWLE